MLSIVGANSILGFFNRGVVRWNGANESFTFDEVESAGLKSFSNEGVWVEVEGKEESSTRFDNFEKRGGRLVDFRSKKYGEITYRSRDGPIPTAITFFSRNKSFHDGIRIRRN